jgi:hypothetical protein
MILTFVAPFSLVLVRTENLVVTRLGIEPGRHSTTDAKQRKSCVSGNIVLFE